MQQKVRFKNNQGQKLAGVFHWPNKKGKYAGVILCHGFTGGKDYNWFPQISEALAKNNMIALRFDFAGNRESEGRFEKMTYTQKISDLKSAINFLWKKGIRRMGVLGESLGAAVAVLTAVEDSRIKAVVVTAPIIYPYLTHTRKLTKEEKLMLRGTGQRVWEDPHQPGAILKLKKFFYQDAKKYNVAKVAKDLIKPTLILQGSNDKLVFMKEVKEFYKGITSDIKELIIFPGAPHKIVKNPTNGKKMIKLIVEWFKKYLARESQTVTSFLEHNGKILILKRSPALNYPGYWNGISGYIQGKESSKKRALIEIKEEAGIKSKDLKLIKAGKPYKIVDNAIDKVWISHPFLFHTKNTKVKLDWEHTAYQWIKPEELKNYQTIPKLAKGLKLVQ